MHVYSIPPCCTVAVEFDFLKKFKIYECCRPYRLGLPTLMEQLCPLLGVLWSCLVHLVALQHCTLRRLMKLVHLQNLLLNYLITVKKFFRPVCEARNGRAKSKSAGDTGPVLVIRPSVPTYLYVNLFSVGNKIKIIVDILINNVVL